jgi:hypothetical protein
MNGVRCPPRHIDSHRTRSGYRARSTSIA